MTPASQLKTHKPLSRAPYSARSARPRAAPPAAPIALRPHHDYLARSEARATMIASPSSACARPASPFTASAHHQPRRHVQDTGRDQGTRCWRAGGNRPVARLCGLWKGAFIPTLFLAPPRTPSLARAAALMPPRKLPKQEDALEARLHTHNSAPYRLTTHLPKITAVIMGNSFSISDKGSWNFWIVGVHMHICFYLRDANS